MKYALGIAVCALFLIAATAPAMAQGAFADVPSDHWAYDAVQELAQSGIVIGYPDGTFKGQRQMTRYEFAMAISRLVEKYKPGEGVPGPKGEKGDVGPAGPAGPQGPAGPAGGGPGLTERQQQLLQQLEQEFMPELKQLRADVDDLVFRVEDLEARPGGGKGPKININGMISVRGGLYGDKLVPGGGGDTTGYPLLSGLAKDSFKAAHFGTMLTRVNLNGQINPNVMVNVSLVAEPRTNAPIELTDASGTGANYAQAGVGETVGIMDMVYVKEAWVKVNTKFIAPLTMKVGKQYFKVSQGLVIDNSLFALKAADLGFDISRGVQVHGIIGLLDREAFGGVLAADPVMSDTQHSNNGQDAYSAATIDIPISDWMITGAYLHSGPGQERAWSVGLKGKLFKRTIEGEFAQGVKRFDGADVDFGTPSSEKNAWVVGANLIETTNLTLGGKYGQIEENYLNAAALTSLFPYEAISPHDIDWVDRPLFLDPSNIAKGWEVNLTYRGLMKGTLPIKVRYYDGDAFDFTNFGQYRRGDPVIVVSVSKQIAQDVMATLLYGRREVKHENIAEGNVIGNLDPDPIQVVRGELSVAF
jgi:hypothetical protein